MGRNRKLVDSFVESMEKNITFYAQEKLSDLEIKYLAEYAVNRMDFENEWQMHKGIAYFARKTVQKYSKEKLITEKLRVAKSQPILNDYKYTPNPLQQIEP